MEGRTSATRVEGFHLVPLYKKKDRKECTNYRRISLLSIPGKVLALLLLERLQAVIDPHATIRDSVWLPKELWYH